MEKKLQNLGLTEYESKVYVALVKNGVQTAKKIGFYADMPTNRVYETCEKLQKLGMVNIILGTPKRYEAIQPKIAVDNYLKVKEDELESIKKGSKRLVTQLNKQEHKPAEDEVKLWTVAGSRSDIAKKGLELLSQIKKSYKVIISVSRRASNEAMLKRQMKLLRKKGIEMKAIYAPCKDLDNFIKFQKSIGINIKHHAFPLHTKMTIIDGNIADIESTFGPEKNWFLVWTNSKPIVKMLDHYFNLVWEESE